uniref:Malectin-like domain-containing protein n=1 Tax=Lactuca sativa TaxID=4236 RepID=A0A9R1UIP4_LACSA|nr:hypothetical protein LSAT_V11C900458120 [Lactuca sativa]
MVHLHFSQFSTNGFEFSNSKLDIFVFSMGNTTAVREFIFPIASNHKFKIEFKPSGSSPSVFVNAIEAFTAPSNLFRSSSTFPRISPTKRIGDLEKLALDYAFNIIHRVNIRVQTINIDCDTLRRTWTPNDPFIFNNGPTRNITFDGQINHVDNGKISFDAPDDVYKRTKQLNNSLLTDEWLKTNDNGLINIYSKS